MMRRMVAESSTTRKRMHRESGVGEGPEWTRSAQVAGAHERVRDGFEHSGRVIAAVEHALAELDQTFGGQGVIPLDARRECAGGRGKLEHTPLPVGGRRGAADLRLIGADDDRTRAGWTGALDLGVGWSRWVG